MTLQKPTEKIICKECKMETKNEDDNVCLNCGSKETERIYAHMDLQNIIEENTPVDTVEEIVEETFGKIDYNLSDRRGIKHNWGYSLDDDIREEIESEIKGYIRTALKTVRKRTEKAFGGCTNCYGKGYATTIQNAVGKKYFKEMPRMRFCECERGKALEKEIETVRKQAYEQGRKSRQSEIDFLREEAYGD